MNEKEKISVAKADLVAAWTVLENLTVSLDQMGSAYAGSDSGGASKHSLAAQEAISDYFTPDLVRAIAAARRRLVEYLPDDETEALSDTIPYWEYVSRPRTPEPSTNGSPRVPAVSAP
jgi:hypothetical protein